MNSVTNLSEFMRWLEEAPPEALLPVRLVLARMREASISVRTSSAVVHETTWRERLWTAPVDTRLGVSELSEAMGRPKSWIYRHTSAKSGLELLPHRRLDGVLVFVIGEIRQWLTQQEDSVMKIRPALIRRNEADGRGRA